MVAQPNFQALTVKSNGLAAQIITELAVTPAYDPNLAPEPLPKKSQTKALWDTGASKSVISQTIAADLNLVPVGATNVTHAIGSSVSPTHLVHFELPNMVRMMGVLVTEFPGTQQFGAIIGMDVIRFGDFSITNVDGRTWMSFRTPSTVAIDYVSDHNKAVFAGTGRNAPCPCGSGKKYKKCHGQ